MDYQNHLVTPEKDEDGASSDKDIKDRSSFKFRVWLIVLKYLDRCTLTGIPFIQTAENKVVKAAWSLLLFAAIAAMIAHLVMLLASFLKYDTYSEVIYSFSALPFPAVTICNVNPIRKSQMHLAEDHLKKLINLIDPDNVDDLLHLPPLNVDNTSSRSSPGPGVSSAIFDDLFLGAYLQVFENDSLNHAPKKDLETFHGKSLWHLLLSVFRKMFAALDVKTRYEMGHQLNDMVLQCYFNGVNCDRKCFTRTASLSYGNCYTLQCQDYQNIESGPNKGLTLVLRLEMDEYIPTISESKGAQVVIHPGHTIPFPEEDGIALSAGTETMVGIQLVEITRLRQPYGRCVSVQKFKDFFGIYPTRNTCIKACEQNMIRIACGCFENVRQEINRILNISKDEHACVNDAERLCVETVEGNFSTKVDLCGCNNPCTERKYEKTVSMRQWPSDAFSRLLSAGVCLKSPHICELLRNKTARELKSEFLKVNIYYEDLNYVQFTEKADYEVTQFISDIGGTIGLWVGLSLLGLCEVLHLVIELVIFCSRRLCCARSGN